jgi:transposase-like protein
MAKSFWNARMTKKRSLAIPVECPNCKMKQKIHVAWGTDATEERDQTIPCIKCRRVFTIKTSSEFVRGPFPV